MKRKINFTALKHMDQDYVIVHDLEYDIYDQICQVHVFKEWIDDSFSKSKKEIIDKIILENEEYIFEFDNLGKTVNGNFEVYTLEHL